MITTHNRNNGRQYELDIAKGLAVFFMILIHLQEYYTLSEHKDSWLGQAIDFLGGIPAAPVFMFLMGVGFVYSSKASKRQLIIRGLFILSLGYVLNILRGTLPSTALYQLTGDAYYKTYALSQLKYGDIFQFSGLAMIFYGTFKNGLNQKFKVLIWILFFALLSFILDPIKIHYPVLDTFTGLLWGSNELSFFPFANWIAYPLFGVIFGQYLIQTPSKKHLYLKVTLLSGIIGSVILFISSKFGLYCRIWDDHLYYHHLFVDLLLAISFIGLWISFIYFILNLIPKVCQNTICRWSRNVTPIYMIHWIIIGWLSLIIEPESLYTSSYIVLFIILLVTSDGLAAHWVNWKKKRAAN